MKQGVFSIENVTVDYGKGTVVEDICLDVEAGETFGLIGLNGTGKTTLIKVALGLLEQKSGIVRIFGKDSGNKNSRENLAFLPERFDPPWFLSGMEFLKFSLDLYRQPFDKNLMIEKAEQLALDPAALRRRVQTYSKGMRQKLGLIATVLTNCKLLILDEPMSGLDPMARSRVKDMLESCKKEGRTIFLSSHILADMDEICDRVAVLNGGAIRYVGTPEELRRQTGCDHLERAFLYFIGQKDAA